MKVELIDKLFKEFDKDKELIKTNLMSYLNEIVLHTENFYGELTLTIKYKNYDKESEVK